MPRAKYPNPPIEEAVCQFAFTEPPNWDIATPGRLFEHFKGRYPGQPAQEQILQANLTPNTSSEPGSFALAQSQRVVFVDETGSRRLTVGPDSLAVHRLRPYVGFEEELLPRVREDLPSVFAVLGTKPAVSMVSMRYINKISIPLDEKILDLGDYFTYWGGSQVLPVPFDDSAMTGFFYKTASESQAKPRTLNLTFGSANAPEGSAAFLLDIDLAHRSDIGVNEALDQLVDLKSMENLIFESLITETCRSLFA